MVQHFLPNLIFSSFEEVINYEVIHLSCEMHLKVITVQGKVKWSSIVRFPLVSSSEIAIKLLSTFLIDSK